MASGVINAISFDGQTLFKVNEGESYTVPDTIAVQSPSGASSGISPTTTFNSQRGTVGGMIYQAVSDAAGPASDNFQCTVNPGDVIAVAAVASSACAVTINGVLVFTIPSVTTHACVLGFVG
jgi:hypothetical protein